MSNLSNKIHNEQLKLFVTSANSVAILTVISAVIVPNLSGRDDVPWVWFFISLAIHLIAQALLFLLRSED